MILSFHLQLHITKLIQVKLIIPCAAKRPKVQLVAPSPKVSKVRFTQPAQPRKSVLAAR